jgi:hypothetical protein
MSVPSLPRPRIKHLLAGAAVTLCALAIYPWLAPPADPAVSARPRERPSSMLVVAPLPALATFSAVFERPLFSPLRRPPSAAGPPVAENGLPPRYQLVGVVRAGAVRRALIIEGANRRDVIEGGVLDGWTIAHIEQDRVLLSSPSGGRSVLKLRRAGEAPAELRKGAPPAP